MLLNDMDKEILGHREIDTIAAELEESETIMTKIILHAFSVSPIPYGTCMLQFLLQLQSQNLDSPDYSSQNPEEMLRIGQHFGTHSSQLSMRMQKSQRWISLTISIHC